jgi:hypothetical protein
MDAIVLAVDEWNGLCSLQGGYQPVGVFGLDVCVQELRH